MYLKIHKRLYVGSSPQILLVDSFAAARFSCRLLVRCACCFPGIEQRALNNEFGELPVKQGDNSACLLRPKCNPFGRNIWRVDPCDNPFNRVNKFSNKKGDDLVHFSCSYRLGAHWCAQYCTCCTCCTFFVFRNFN
jgi:hypothetical protein